MADDESKKQHAIYGSAGMAAAGMIPSGKKKKSKSVTPPSAIAPWAADDAEGDSSDSPAPSSLPAVSEKQTVMAHPTVPATYRAAAIGHTGAGNFGHSLDVIFKDLPDVDFVAVADANKEALDETHRASGAKSAYTDYLKMLEVEKPDLVSVGPRWTNQHYAMVKAALESGAHVICERPLTRTLKEADELLALAESKNLKIAVVHQMRCDPHVTQFHEQRAELIGELLEMKVFGMMDHRAGGEDLLVLGTHLFDIVRWFAGEVSYCTAQITKNGETAIAEDSHLSEKEDLGPLLGDCIHAEFAMESGVHVSYVSDRRLHLLHGPWGIEFIGSKGKARLFAGMPPTLSLLIEDDPTSPDRASVWKRWPEKENDYHKPVDGLIGTEASNRILAEDWLSAIREDREPTSSGERSLKSLEMIHGVWQAGCTMRRAYFPLVNRLHPLSEE